MLPFERVLVVKCWVRRERPAEVSGQGSRKCQIRLISWISVGVQRVERECWDRRVRRESRWWASMDLKVSV